METPNEKFMRLAKKRMNSTLECYRKLANLGTPAYKATMGQKREIIEALRHGLEALEVSFAGEKVKKEEFTFKSEMTYENGADLDAENS